MSKRVTQHNGRTARNGKGFNEKHNDRRFDIEQADNIDELRTNQNLYWNFHDGSYGEGNKDDKLSFEEAETRFYERYFKHEWKETNDKYIKQRHPERCKSFEDWSKQKSNLPEETILQIGNSDNNTDKNLFKRAYIGYWNKLNEWNKQHGNVFKILDFSIHNDEAVPHVHLRKAWCYKDTNNQLKIGQEKALKQAGIPLPNPEAKQGRYNNRKMTFDAMSRNMWIEACKEVGLEIEESPVLGGKHNMSKQQTIEEKLKLKEAELANKDAELSNKIHEFNNFKHDCYEQVRNMMLEFREDMGRQTYDSKEAWCLKRYLVGINKIDDYAANKPMLSQRYEDKNDAYNKTCKEIDRQYEAIIRNSPRNDLNNDFDL